MNGRTADNVHSLEVLTYDGLRLTVGPTSERELNEIVAGGGRRGEIYLALRQLRDHYAALIRERYPDIPRRVSGYNLDQLLPENGFQVARALVGTEGTCVTVLEATLDLIPWPAHRVLVTVSYEDAYQAADHVMEVLDAGPMACEGLDSRLIEDQRKKHMHPADLELLPDGGGWLLVEFGGDSAAEAVEKAESFAAKMEPKASVVSVKVFPDEDRQAKVWEIRESGLGATARVPGQGDTWPGWEDSAVPPEKLGDYMRDLRRLLDEHGLHGSFYGHFGQGCLHTRQDFDLRTRAGIDNYLAYVDAAADLVVRYGGSLSGEHGDGQSRAELLPKMYGEELCRAFREFKGIWDPGGRMNPGKVVDPYPIASNLRLGTDYRPADPDTHFQFVDDDFSFARATLRCVGVGKCRREGGGTMCPSYMVTREEMHSTRGRAHLLHEMLTGDLVTGGWKSEEVKEALDLCLACKGCKADCPVNVDMATYKAEFLSHYYAHRPRPMYAYSMGLITWWARLASKAPRLVNLATHTPGLADAIKRLGGIDARREMPPFATWTFRDWFAENRPRHLRVGAGAGRDGFARGRDRRVLLFPDTFNNFFHPETAVAMVEVLERAGYEVAIPRKSLCCGRPLYDYGWLDQAKRQLEEILDELAPEIEAGVPMVVPEPSCAATFRDELSQMLPHDQHAKRLVRQTRTLAELLGDTEGFTPPRLARRALFHGHCHHKSVMGIDADKALLERMGLELEAPATGCCGLAGSFGFEEGKYDLSMAAGERVLFPAVGGMGERDLVISDGFSCRHQIHEGTERRALHLAQVLQMAYREGAGGPPGERPERDYVRGRVESGLSPTVPVLAAVAAAAGALATGLALRRRRDRAADPGNGAARPAGTRSAAAVPAAEPPRAGGAGRSGGGGARVGSPDRADDSAWEDAETGDLAAVKQEEQE